MKFSLYAFYLSLAIMTALGSTGIPGSICHKNEDCQQYYDCIGDENFQNCVHKPLFPNASARELAGVFISLIINALLTSVGVGSGALLTPYLRLFNNFSPNDAVVMAYPMVFGGILGTAIHWIWKRRPETNGPLISYDNLLLVTSALQIGAPIGVLLNHLLAPIILSGLLLTLVGVTILGMTIRYVLFFIKEKKGEELFKKQKANQIFYLRHEISIKYPDETHIASNSSPNTITPQNEDLQFSVREKNKTVEDSGNTHNNAAAVKTKSMKMMNTEDLKIEKIRKRDQRLFPLEKICLQFFFLIVTVALNLLLGTAAVKSIAGVGACAPAHWGIFSALIAAYCLFFFWICCLIMKWRRDKVAIGWDLTRELKITNKRVAVFFIFGIIGGILSGLLAVGGIMITGLFLFHFGVAPLPLIATISFILIVTQFTPLLMAVLAGNYTACDLAFFLCSSALFSFVTAKIVHYIVRRTKRQSYIIAHLIVLLFISFVLYLVITLVEL